MCKSHMVFECIMGWRKNSGLWLPATARFAVKNIGFTATASMLQTEKLSAPFQALIICNNLSDITYQNANGLVLSETVNACIPVCATLTTYIVTCCLSLVPELKSSLTLNWWQANQRYLYPVIWWYIHDNPILLDLHGAECMCQPLPSNFTVDLSAAVHTPPLSTNMWHSLPWVM